MTTFQHAKYIANAIQSILRQNFVDYELIIVDDGSTDGTRHIVSNFTDRRIRLIFKPNGGPSSAINAGIAIAKGNFIALMSGDDMCLPDWLEAQLNSLAASNSDATFCLPQLIDDTGASLPDTKLRIYYTADIQNSVTALKYFFWSGNALLAPGAVLTREIVDKVGLFQPHLYQLQDFDYWIRIAKLGSIARTTQRKILYRIRDDGNNLGSAKNERRIRLEREAVYSQFFSGLSRDMLFEVFDRDIKLWFAPEDDQQVEQFSWLLFLQHSDPALRDYGWQNMARALSLGKHEYHQIGPFKVTARALARIAAA